MELVKKLHGNTPMKLSPYTKAVLAAYRELKAAGKSYDEIRSDPRALEIAGTANEVQTTQGNARRRNERMH